MWQHRAGHTSQQIDEAAANALHVSPRPARPSVRPSVCQLSAITGSHIFFILTAPARRTRDDGVVTPGKTAAVVRPSG